jgi:predicted metal-dependent enzyme (double-stranded beta helix superfamily)
MTCTSSSAALREFAGRDRLIAAVDAAVAEADPDRITKALRNSLCALIRDGSVQLPECVRQPLEGHYARRELYRSPEHGYGIIAMTWGPGQGTSIHDHHGLWCVEGVWHGQIEITQYDLAERDGDAFRFIEIGNLIAGTGSAGCLIPPHEYHAIRNPNPGETAVSVHIYQEPMTCCGVFAQGDDGWHRYIEKQLSLDEAA